MSDSAIGRLAAKDSVRQFGNQSPLWRPRKLVALFRRRALPKDWSESPDHLRKRPVRCGERSESVRPIHANRRSRSTAVSASASAFGIEMPFLGEVGRRMLVQPSGTVAEGTNLPKNKGRCRSRKSTPRLRKKKIVPRKDSSVVPIPDGKRRMPTLLPRSPSFAAQTTRSLLARVRRFRQTTSKRPVQSRESATILGESPDDFVGNVIPQFLSC